MQDAGTSTHPDAGPPAGAPAKAPAEAPITVEALPFPPPPDPWGGLPPVGKQPIGDRTKFLLSVVSVFVVWFLLWLLFRYGSLAFVQGSDAFFAVASIIAAPTLTLLPPYFWWRYVRHERGLPFLLTRRNLFTSVLIGAIAAALFWIVNNASLPVLMWMVGAHPEGELRVVANWRGETLGWLAYTSFLYMCIVGPVEELFNRGFLQDQINRAYRPYVGILVSSVLFVLGHVPIDFLVYQVDAVGWALRWISSFPFAVAMGAFYHWSRNIWGPAVYHGLYDWYLSMGWIDYSVVNLVSNGQLVVMMVLWSAMELLIIVGLAYMGYRMWWRGSRPSGSLGLGLGERLLAAFGGALRGLYATVARSGLARWARRVDLGGRGGQQTMTMGVVLVVMLGSLGGLGAIGFVPEGYSLSPIDGGGGGGGTSRNLTFNASEYLDEGSSTEVPCGDGPMEVVAVRAMLLWQDEPAFRRGFTNTPDTFSVELMTADGTSLASQEGDSGQVMTSWIPDSTMDMDQVVVVVTAVSCGDQVPTINPLGLRARADTGNDFTLIVEIEVSS
jgi:membrane protease YdiL (CAAX protease family)